MTVLQLKNKRSLTEVTLDPVATALGSDTAR
jgi:hypothetical protein